MRNVLIAVLAAGGACAQPVITPATPPVVVVGGTIQLTADRPVNWSMSPGSAGTIDPDGTYHAPTAIPARQSVGGCQMLPGNHIYNTRIDGLPVNPNNGAWIATTNASGPVNYIPSFPVNYIGPASPSQQMIFYYTPAANGIFGVPQLPDVQIESGWYAEVGDRHLITMNSSTCDMEEMYGLYNAGLNASCNTCTSQAGVKYNANDMVLPSSGTDAAQMLLTPLALHANELVAGGEIRHALRVTLAHPQCNGVAWPAQAGACAGWYTGQVPMGGWARMKSSVNLASLNLSPLAMVLAVQMQRYGLIVADAGGEWQITTSADSFTADQMASFKEIYQKITGSMLEFVDTTGLQAKDPALLAAAGCATADRCGIANPAVKPGEIVVATDASGATSSRVVVLTSAAVGVPNQTIAFQAGGPPRQMQAFVSGAADTSVTWSMSPQIGQLTPDGKYTPPASVDSDVVQTTTFTVTSNADPTATAGIVVTILPQGTIRLYGGPTDYTDSQGHIWHSDNFLFPGGGYGTNYDPQWPKNIPDIAIYQWTHRSYGDITYILNVPNGNYKVTMKAAQTYTPVKVGDAIFHWEAQGQLVYRNVDEVKLAGGNHIPIDFPIPVQVTDGRMYIAARHVRTEGDPGAPSVSAILVEPDNSSPRLAVYAFDTGSLTIAKTRQFYAIGWYMDNSVTWSISPALGSIDASGVYTAPATPVLRDTPVTVTATSASVPGLSATATLTLSMGTITVNPASGTVVRGTTQQFTASINGQNYSNVTWSVQPVGTISASGLYTAPDTLASDASIVVTATSKDDGTTKASGTLKLLAQMPPIRIACGDLGSFTDAQGRIWAADPGPTSTVNPDYVMAYHDTTATFSNVSQDMQRLFQASRYGHADASFSYQFPAPSGSYTVTLYFGLYSANKDTTDMNVLINGTSVLSRFNISTAAGGPFKGYSQSFPVTVTNRTIRIDFNSNWPAGSPWEDVGADINGIEIVTK
jgi:hypothetical protein